MNENLDATNEQPEDVVVEEPFTPATPLLPRSRPWLALGMALAACWLCSGEASAESQPLDAQREAWSRTLEERPFGFADHYSGLLASLRQFSADAKVHVIFDPTHKSTLKFHFTHNDRELVRLKGHDQSAFATYDNLLYFAHYPTDSDGCKVAAYDLATGKQLWKTELHQPRPRGHSGYRNLVAMRLSGAGEIDGGSNGDAIIITGKESFCDYVEVLDRKTGASLAMKAYRQGFGASKPVSRGGFGGTNRFEAPRRRHSRVTLTSGEPDSRPVTAL